MSDHKVGDHVLVKLSGGRIVAATIKAVDTTEGVRLQVCRLGRRRRGSICGQIVEEQA
jgi:small nuclear ribonucleoprotein (snRNP)-like protein